MYDLDQIDLIENIVLTSSWRIQYISILRVNLKSDSGWKNLIEESIG